MRRTSTLVPILVLLAGVAHASRASAQELPTALRPADPKDVVRVMIVGTFHFHTPNADQAKFQGIDVLAPRRQREIEEVVARLERFRPTRIAVEHPPEEADSINARYRRYRAGTFALTANETHQLGYRLAARLGHDALFPVDHQMGMRIDSVLAYAGAHDRAFADSFNAYIAQVVGLLDRMQAERTIGDNLRWMNDPAVIARAHESYPAMATVGAGDGYVGARVIADWYERNLHMFANLARASRPGDRVLLIVGQGHAFILRELVRTHPRMELVEPLEYLR